MASPQYSKSVLHGLQKLGLLPRDVAKITGLSEPRVRSILLEKAHFTDGNLAAIEEATSMSAGQLAMSTLDADESFKAIINGWAAVGSNKSRATRRATPARS